MSAPIAVVVGLLVDTEGRLLLCQRAPDKNYPLEWEFPGGKVEPGEEPAPALVRELREELGIEAVVGRLLYEKVSHYANGGAFAVAYYHIERWTGEPRNLVFADVRWVEADRLMDFEILSGNREFCTRLAREGPGGFIS